MRWKPLPSLKPSRKNISAIFLSFWQPLRAVLNNDKYWNPLLLIWKRVVTWFEEPVCILSGFTALDLELFCRSCRCLEWKQIHPLFSLSWMLPERLKYAYNLVFLSKFLLRFEAIVDSHICLCLIHWILYGKLLQSLSNL